MDKISTAPRSSSDALTVKTNFLLTLWKKLKIIQKKVSGNSGASLFELVVNVCFFSVYCWCSRQKVGASKSQTALLWSLYCGKPSPRSFNSCFKGGLCFEKLFLKVDVQVFVSYSISSSDNLRRRCDYMTEEQGCQRFHSSQASRGSPLSRRTFSYFV